MGQTKLPAHVRRLLAPHKAKLPKRRKPDPPVRDGRAALLSSLSERDFQEMVVEGLRARGYHVWIVPDMRMTTAGLPDLLFFHPRRPGLLFAWELKTATGKPSHEQLDALDHLETVRGIDARLVRPADWDYLKEQL